MSSIGAAHSTSPPHPTPGGRFLGDYNGLTAVGSRFHPFFATTNCQLSCPANRTDIYTAAVTPTATTRPSSDTVTPGQRSGTAGVVPRRLASIR
jgi:hypothetical protein